MLLTFIIPAMLGGCSVAPERIRQLPPDGEALPVLREKLGSYSNIERRLRLVIHDAGSMATIPVDIGPVDFDREMVVLAALGPAPSPEFGIRIRKLVRRGDKLRADVEIQHPPLDAPRRSQSCSPYHIIVVPRCDLNVVGFVVRQEKWTPKR